MQKICRGKNKRIICILILFVMIYTMLGIIPQTSIKSYGATYTYTSKTNDLPSDFDSKYPNYRILINTLASEHPNWTFKLYETGLDWKLLYTKEKVDNFPILCMIQLNDGKILTGSNVVKIYQ